MRVKLRAMSALSGQNSERAPLRSFGRLLVWAETVFRARTFRKLLWPLLGEIWGLLAAHRSKSASCRAGRRPDVVVPLRVRGPPIPPGTRPRPCGSAFWRGASQKSWGGIFLHCGSTCRFARSPSTSESSCAQLSCSKCCLVCAHVCPFLVRGSMLPRVSSPLGCRRMGYASGDAVVLRSPARGYCRGCTGRRRLRSSRRDAYPPTGCAFRTGGARGTLGGARFPLVCSPDARRLPSHTLHSCQAKGLQEQRCRPSICDRSPSSAPE